MKKRILGIVLCLVMVLMLVPVGTRAFADGTVPNGLTVDGTPFESTLYDKTNIPASGGGTWSWNKTTATLTLNNYKGGAISMGGAIANSAMTIKLVGTNTITASSTGQCFGITDSGIYGATIRITSESSGSLTINVTGGKQTAGVCLGYNQPNSSLTVDGSARVTVNATCNATNYDGFAIGLYAGSTGTVTIGGSAAYAANCKAPSCTNSALAPAIGIYSGGTINVNTTGIIDMDVSNVPSSGYGMRAMTQCTVECVRKMQITCRPDGKDIVLPTITAANFAINSGKDSQRMQKTIYRYGTPYTVSVSSGICSADGIALSKMQYLAGDTVTLLPNTMSVPFSRWESSDVSISSNRFTMPGKNVAVTALFDPFVEMPSFRLTILGEEGRISYKLCEDIDDSDLYARLVPANSTADAYQAVLWGDDRWNGLTVNTGMVPAGSYRMAIRTDGVWHYSPVFKVDYSTHTHTAQSGWAYDGTKHWHGCDVSGCTYQMNVSSHTYGNSHLCTVCGAPQIFLTQPGFTATEDGVSGQLSFAAYDSSIRVRLVKTNGDYDDVVGRQYSVSDGTVLYGNNGTDWDVPAGSYRLAAEYDGVIFYSDVFIVSYEVVYSPGDVDGDGFVTDADLTKLLRHVAKIQLITDSGELDRANVDGKGGIDAADVTTLARKLGG